MNSSANASSSHDSDTIYLAGDIVEGWALQSSWYWRQSHNDFGINHRTLEPAAAGPEIGRPLTAGQTKSASAFLNAIIGVPVFGLGQS